MLNKEKYAKEIIDILCKTENLPAVVNNKPIECNDVQCKSCAFSPIYSCRGKFAEWANSEYKEREIDWTKVPVDTPVCVRNREKDKWMNRYFAKYENKIIYAWSDGATSWSSNDLYSSWKQCKLAEGTDCSKWYKD